MLTQALRWVVSAVTALALLYLFFFVPLGTRTLYEHARRVASTEEAQELGRDVSRASQQVLDRTREELESQLRFDLREAGAGDATAPSPRTAARPRGGRQLTAAQ